MASEIGLDFGNERVTLVGMLHSLTKEQADWLRLANESPDGVYCGLSSGPAPAELVDGGCATFREVRKEFDHGLPGYRGAYTELWLVPTAYGLELLAVEQKRKGR